MKAGKINPEWLDCARHNECDDEIGYWFEEIFNQDVSLDFSDGTIWLVRSNAWASQEQIDQAVKTINARG